MTWLLAEIEVGNTVSGPNGCTSIQVHPKAHPAIPFDFELRHFSPINVNLYHSLWPSSSLRRRLGRFTRANGTHPGPTGQQLAMYGSQKIHGVGQGKSPHEPRSKLRTFPDTGESVGPLWKFGESSRNRRLQDFLTEPHTSQNCIQKASRQLPRLRQGEQLVSTNEKRTTSHRCGCMSE